MPATGEQAKSSAAGRGMRRWWKASAERSTSAPTSPSQPATWATRTGSREK